MQNNYISEIILNNFRNYSNKKFTFVPDFNAIIGDNGAGKTNLLEAITMFSNSRGLRNATTDELVNMKNSCSFLPKNILYSLLINFSDGQKILILQEQDKKTIKINDTAIKKASILNNYLKITFLTPQMDTFFLDSPSVRRKFLDKTAELMFADHYDNVKKYEFFLKERMKIITTQTVNDKWLDIVEKKIASLATAIANVRNETIFSLNKIFENYTKNFSTGIIKINGIIENKLLAEKAIDVEKFVFETMKKNRITDAFNKRTELGIHKSDLVVINKDNGMPANLCSTGEQKMLLLSLIFVRTIFSKQNTDATIVLLLDEICSHIDEENKQKLYKELQNLNVQVFLTGLERNDFLHLTNNFIEL